MKSLSSRIRSAVFFGIAAIALIVIGSVGGCGSDSPTPPGDPELSATLTIEDLEGGGVDPADTMLSVVTVVNSGESADDNVYVRHHGVSRHRLQYLGATVDPPVARTTEADGAAPEAAPTAGVLPLADSPLEFLAGPLTVPAGNSVQVTFRFVLPANLPNRHRIEFQADIDPDGITVDEEPIFPTDDPATPAEGDPTILTIANPGVDFRLRAPGAELIYVSGDFNGWNPSAAGYQLFDSGTGRDWAITVPLIGRHEYKFVLNGVTPVEWIGDPRATRVVSDGFAGLNSVLGQPLPPKVEPLPGGIDPAKLVIYEMFTYDFSAAGTFNEVTRGLDGDPQNLAGLGVNAIELLPVTANPGNFNWGYEPFQYFAVDPSYGTPEDFAALVTKAHSLGMAVILDMVFNHVGSGSPLQQLDQAGTPGAWLSLTQPDVFGMRQTNWLSADVREYFLDAASFWIDQYGIDGFRMDLVDPEDYNGLAWWRDQLRARHPNAFIIGEDFSHPPANSVTVAGFDAQWGGQKSDPWGGISNNFQNTVMAILKEGPYSGRAWFPPRGSFDSATNPMWALANVLSPTPGYPSAHNEVKYIVSHDERHLVEEVMRDGSAGAKAIGGIKKAKLGAITLMTTVGIPMLYMGEEIGEDSFVTDSPNPNKVDWAAGDAGVRAVYRNMIRLRLTHPDLASGEIEFFCPEWSTQGSPCQENKTLNYWRFTGDMGSAGVVVAANFDNVAHTLSVRFPRVGAWDRYDPETGMIEDVPVGGSLTLQVELPASEAWIYFNTPKGED